MERVAIVGTAPSWSKTPWTDPGLHILSLNDAYRLKGFVRADAWYDFHPLNCFFSPPNGAGQLYEHQIPAGHYVRPSDHREWLGRQSQTIPVWLHPEFLTQWPEAAGWPKAQAFPKADIEAAFGRYFTSSPAWMMAHAILQGAKEIQIYGIHLATEQEYIEQRPNFEYLCGRVLGPSKVTLTVSEGIRRYESPDGIIMLPEASPILSSDFQYAFQTRPRAHLAPLKWDAHRYSVKRERAMQQLRTKPWWQSRAQIVEDLYRIEAHLADAQDQMARMQLAAQIGGR